MLIKYGYNGMIESIDLDIFVLVSEAVWDVFTEELTKQNVSK